MEKSEPDDDHEMLMDHCAMEMMDAIEHKDKEKFRESFETLISDILMKMESSEHEEGEE